MEASIGKFSKTVAAFCNHLQTSSDALKQSVDRRPIPLDSASTTFVQCLNRRVSSASSDLNLLESMSFGTVSFEELLGHCNEVYKKNQNDLLIDFTRKIEDDPLLDDDSLNLKNLGLSDACLATLAPEANCMVDEEPFQSVTKILDFAEDEMDSSLMSFEDSTALLCVSLDDYEILPKHMKSLASWEDLLAAVEKINLCLRTKKTKPCAFQLDEVESLGLGHKARSYLLLLIKMNRVVVETAGGLISYRIL
nr:Angiomotin like [Ipomoea batatas]